MRETPKGRLGFSIIEILIVMGIIALGMMILVPAWNNLTGLQLRSSASDLSRLINSTFSDAALSGGTYRIVFEMVKDEEADVVRSAYWIEASADEARGEELFKEEEGSRFIDAHEREKNKYLKKPEFLPVKGNYQESFEKQTFPGSVRLYGAWIEGMEERKREGTIYLYFFPTGYTQRAQISLTDDDGANVLNLIIEPLTGEVIIEDAEKPFK